MEKVAVLHAEIPETAPEDEQDVMIQVQAASRSLERLGYAPVQVPISLDLAAAQQRLASIRPAFVFNLVESLNGKGKLIHLAPALLDSLGLSYTGAATEAVFLTSNKLAAKKILKLSGLDTPAAHTAATLTGGTAVEGRYIIKAIWEHASIGIGEDSVIDPHTPAALRHALLLASRTLGEDCFCEQYIEGREFNLSLLAGDQGPEVLAPAEIRFDAFPPERLRIVDYRAKWDTASFEYQHTPRSFEFEATDAPLLRNLKALALACWHCFDLRGYARVDFRVDAGGRPWVLEINTNPCLAPDAGFIAAADRSGLDFDAVIRRVVAAVDLQRGALS